METVALDLIPQRTPSDGTQPGVDVPEGPTVVPKHDDSSDSERSTHMSDSDSSPPPAKSPKKRIGDSLRTPMAPKRPDRSRRQKKCYCYPMSLEADYNTCKEITNFDSQLKHIEFEANRKQHLLLIDTLLSSEFLIGKGMCVKVALLRDDSLNTGDRVILVILQGKNEVKVPAVRFLKSTVSKINNYMMFYDENETEELPIVEDAVFAEFFEDSTTQWVGLKAYESGNVTECVYMCSPTWVQMKTLAPVMLQCAEHYTNLILSGGVCEPNVECSPIVPQKLFS